MSIKKKFATAVATAGLLAGLFGSALVPSAMAGNVDSSAAAFKASYTTVKTWTELWETDQDRDMARAGTSKVFGFPSNWSADGDNDWESSLQIGLFNSDHTKLDLSAAGNTTTILKAVSSNSNVKLAWAYNDSSVEQACNGDDVEDNMGASSSFVNLTNADQDEISSTSADFQGYWLCFAAKKETTAATSTITVSVGGVTATTFTMTAIGPIATVSVALNGSKYVAGGNNQIDDWATVIAKDAAGVVINGADNSISPNSDVYADDIDEQVDNAAGDSIDAADDGYLDSDGKTHESYNQMQINSDVCNSADAYGEDGDEGKSYSLKFQAADYQTNDEYVEGNAVSITCTGDASGAKVTKVTAEAVTGDTTYEELGLTDDGVLSVNATIVDADGLPLGNGAGSLDWYGMAFEFKSGSDTCLGDNTTGFYTEAIDGVAEIGTLAPEDCNPGKKSYTVVVANSDLAVSGAGDDPVEKKFVLSYTAAFAGHDGDISKTRNKAKTRATITADFGEDAAYGKVTFTVTTSKGVDQIFTRNANGDGVATLVLNRRNTRIYVFADATDFGDLFVGSTGIIAIRFR